MLHFLCFNHFFVGLLVCLGPLSCCITHLEFSSKTHTLTFCCRICLYNSEFRCPSIMASCPGPEAAKQPQTMILPPPCIMFGLQCLLFAKYDTFHFYFEFICPQNILPVGLWIIHMAFSKLHIGSCDFTQCKNGLLVLRCYPGILCDFM